jgi:hypothetical protein
MYSRLQKSETAIVLCIFLNFVEQTFRIEFTQQENLLQDLEADVITFREQKKLEAAERLEQQIALLKVSSIRAAYKLTLLNHCNL